MKWITHQAGAIFLGLSLGLPTAGVACASAGAILPDVIDQKISGLGSTRGQRQRIFNRIHRGASHWFGWWFIILIGAACYPFGYMGNEVLAGLAFGGLSHVGFDMLTPQGVPLTPFSRKKRLSLNLCRTGSIGEYIFLGCLLICGGILFRTDLLELSKNISHYFG